MWQTSRAAAMCIIIACDVLWHLSKPSADIVFIFRVLSKKKYCIGPLSQSFKIVMDQRWSGMHNKCNQNLDVAVYSFCFCFYLYSYIWFIYDIWYNMIYVQQSITSVLRGSPSAAASNPFSCGLEVPCDAKRAQLAYERLKDAVHSKWSRWKHYT